MVRNLARRISHGEVLDISSIFYYLRRGQQGLYNELHVKRLASGKEIICLASNTRDSVTRVTLGTRDGVIQVMTIDKGELRSIFSVRIDTMVPIKVGFMDNAAKDVFVFGLHCGQMFVLSRLCLLFF